MVAVGMHNREEISMPWRVKKKNAAATIAELSAKITEEIENADRDLEQIKRDIEKVPKVRNVVTKR